MHLRQRRCEIPKFIPYNYDQTSMVVINFKDQLQPGTFEYAVYYLINEKLDLSIFIQITIITMAVAPLMTLLYC